MFAVALQQLREVAKEHGYALGVHGSMYRDLDLIAAPWTPEAVEPEELIEALRQAIGGWIRNETEWDSNPTKKPHGRLAWSIYTQYAKEGENFYLGPYLDVSVMPKCKE